VTETAAAAVGAGSVGGTISVGAASTVSAVGAGDEASDEPSDEVWDKLGDARG
jgi:hypothetical protein